MCFERFFMPSKDKSDQSHIDQCIALGDAAFSKEQLLEATTRYAQARVMLKQAGISDSDQLRHCLETLGEIYDKRDKPEEALEIIQALRTIDDSIDNRRAYITFLHRIAGAYEKQGERDRAEEAYSEALTEATELLPADDPLLGRLNTACIEIFKRTVKSRKLTTSDAQVKLSTLHSAVPFEETHRPIRKPNSSYRREGIEAAEGRGNVRQKANSRLTKMRILLQSNVLALGLSLVLIVSLIQAAIFIQQKQAPAQKPSVHKSTPVVPSKKTRLTHQ
jgi:tetratricopeptide (TPR) repeat protein